MALIGGTTFTVTDKCAVEIESIGSSLCTYVSEVSTVASNTGGTSTSGLATAALVISILALLLMVLGFAVLTLLYIQGNNKRLVKLIIMCIDFESTYS